LWRDLKEAFAMTGKVSVLLLIVLSAAALVAAQGAKPGLLGAQDLKKAVPDSYFFNGQSAPVQMRNAAGFRTSKGQMFLAAMVDTSGYSSDVQQKYQGLVITEAKVMIGDSSLEPGQYAFGTTKEGKFVLMNVAGTELFSDPIHTDDKMARPVPLKIIEDGGAYKLYLGKRWVAVKSE
jgi:hypothetical protein